VTTSGILARQGKLGSLCEGDSLFQVAAEDIAHGATACNCCKRLRVRAP